MLVEGIKTMWLKYRPHFLCKEVRETLEERKNEVAKFELLLALKGKKIVTSKNMLLYSRIYAKKNSQYFAIIRDQDDDSPIMMYEMYMGYYQNYGAAMDDEFEAKYNLMVKMNAKKIT